jgi:hypothetical protein
MPPAGGGSGSVERLLILPRQAQTPPWPSRSSANARSAAARQRLLAAGRVGERRLRGRT